MDPTLHSLTVLNSVVKQPQDQDLAVSLFQFLQAVRHSGDILAGGDTHHPAGCQPSASEYTVLFKSGSQW